MSTVRDVHGLAIGSVSAVTDVITVDYAEAAPEIIGGADDDTYASIAEFGMGAVRGSINFRDPQQAESIAHQSNKTLSFNAKIPGGGTDKTYSFSGVSTGGVSGQIVRDGISMFAVPFVAVSAGGSTNPVSITG